jgi:hypothetical protein
MAPIPEPLVLQTPAHQGSEESVGHFGISRARDAFLLLITLHVTQTFRKITPWAPYAVMGSGDNGQG